MGITICDRCINTKIVYESDTITVTDFEHNAGAAYLGAPNNDANYQLICVAKGNWNSSTIYIIAIARQGNSILVLFNAQPSVGQKITINQAWI